MVRRHKSDDYIGPSTGVMKWANKFFRFILFPFIHPLVFVVLLAVLGGAVVGVHHFYGVAYKDIPLWVVNQNISFFDEVTNKYDIKFLKNITSKIDDVKNESEKVLSDIKEVKQPDVKEKSSRKVVRAIERKAFRKAQDIPIDVKATIKSSYSNKNIVETQSSKKDLFSNYKKNETLGLVYTKNPRVVKGEISILNVNEIVIGGEEMFLYGIYSEPKSENGIAGASYLKKLVKGKKAECRVVAFTQNAELTAICVVDGININHKMVDIGYSKNVSLR